MGPEKPPERKDSRYVAAVFVELGSAFAEMPTIAAERGLNMKSRLVLPVTYLLEIPNVSCHTL
jgi:hypothetical protein